MLRPLPAPVPEQMNNCIFHFHYCFVINYIPCSDFGCVDSVLVVQNIAAWVVAGTVAYYLWVLPDQRKEEAKRVRLTDTYVLYPALPAEVDKKLTRPTICSNFPQCVLGTPSYL